jgi:hypothetical protein
MHIKPLFTLIATALGGFGSCLIAPTAIAQVNVLTYQDVRGSTTTEVTLTNSRGVLTLPGFASATVGSASGGSVIGIQSKWTMGAGINEDHISDRNGATLVIDQAGNTTDKFYATGQSAPQVWTFSNLSVSGYGGSGQPVEYSGNADLWIFNGGNFSFNTAVTVPTGTAGVLVLPSGVPDGFTTIAPDTLTTASTLPTNIPELNAAAMSNLQATPNLPNLTTPQNQTTLRANGVHTRIMPEFTPGLYQ